MFAPLFRFALSTSVLSAIFCLAISPVKAQVLTSEGVAGDMDAKSRGPALSVSSTIGSSKVTILADAHHPSKEFDKYPVQFDFFINRQFFTSQYRSPTLPGPIGVEVPNSVAKPPFNYVVVAKTLHPNSIYTTVIEAAVYNQTLSGTLDCTLTRTPASGSETIYTAERVVTTQSGNSVFVVEFNASGTDSVDPVNVKATVTVATKNDESTGTIEFREQDDSTSTITGNASVDKTNSEVRAFTITADDEATVLSCSK